MICDWVIGTAFCARRLSNSINASPRGDDGRAPQASPHPRIALSIGEVPEVRRQVKGEFALS